jgi:pimeloyl-ACP methyl ester carboxylesterase
MADVNRSDGSRRRDAGLRAKGEMMTEHRTEHRQIEGPPVGRLYDVGGQRLMLHRSGSGGPPVVFLPGASAVGLDYLNLHDRASELTTSVLYDRGGTGWSDHPAEPTAARPPAITLPRSAADVAAELRDLLRTAGVTGPYLLVAHSLGGAYARRFGQLFPDEVAGVLYLDAFYEDSDAYMPERLHLARLRQPEPGPVQLALMRPFMRRMYRRMFADWPETVRGVLIERHLSPEWWQVGVRERSNMPELADELKGGGNVPDRPVIVLTPLGIDPGLRLLMSPRALRQEDEGKRRRNQALADSVSSGEHRLLEGARHSTITVDKPDAVLQAIRDLMDRTAT